MNHIVLKDGAAVTRLPDGWWSFRRNGEHIRHLGQFESELIRATLASLSSDAELEQRTEEPHVDGWPLVSGLPASPAAPAEQAFSFEMDFYPAWIDENPARFAESVREFLKSHPGDKWVCRISKFGCLIRLTAARKTEDTAPSDPSRDAEEATAEIMEQAQAFASAWSLVGGRFDSGTALDDANEAKDELRTMVLALASLAAAAPQAEPQPLSDNDLDLETMEARDELLDFIYEHGTNAEGILKQLRKFARAVERANGIGTAPKGDAS